MGAFSFFVCYLTIILCIKVKAQLLAITAIDTCHRILGLTI